ncbi:hypothetical protein BX666DRAFT_1996683 [Dichotomocladium elegans]|nr:hypothetical protein BX666DRAFT_1996683 [Dichotomocladium elegans]
MLKHKPTLLLNPFSGKKRKASERASERAAEKDNNLRADEEDRAQRMEFDRQDAEVGSILIALANHPTTAATTTTAAAAAAAPTTATLAESHAPSHGQGSMSIQNLLGHSNDSSTSTAIVNNDIHEVNNNVDTGILVLMLTTNVPLLALAFHPHLYIIPPPPPKKKEEKQRWSAGSSSKCDDDDDNNNFRSYAASACFRKVTIAIFRSIPPLLSCSTSNPF